MAGGNRYKHRSLGGGLVPNNQQAPSNNFYAAPLPEPSLLEKALQIAQALGDASSEYTGKANADPGNRLSPFGPVPTQFIKDSAKHLWDEKFGLVPAKKAWDSGTALADILSGKQQSTPFASAQGTQLAGDTANNAALAALDASTLIPGMGVVPRMGKGAGKVAGAELKEFRAMREGELRTRDPYMGSTRQAVETPPVENKLDWSVDRGASKNIPKQSARAQAAELKAYRDAREKLLAFKIWMGEPNGRVNFAEKAPARLALWREEAAKRGLQVDDFGNASDGITVAHPTTLGMGFPFSGKDGEKPLLSALMDAFKGKQAPAANPLDQFTPPTSLDDIFTGGSPRGPREITGGAENPAGLEGSAFHDPRFNGPQEPVPYNPESGFGGLDSTLGRKPTDLGMGAKYTPADATRRSEPFFDARLTPTENKVAEMTRNGYTTPEIADELLVTEWSIRTMHTHIRQKGVEIPTIRNPSARDEVLRLAKKGLTGQQIAERIGKDLNNVNVQIHNLRKGGFLPPSTRKNAKPVAATQPEPPQTLADVIAATLRRPDDIPEGDWSKILSGVQSQNDDLSNFMSGGGPLFNNVEFGGAVSPSGRIPVETQMNPYGVRVDASKLQDPVFINHSHPHIFQSPTGDVAPMSLSWPDLNAVLSKEARGITSLEPQGGFGYAVGNPKAPVLGDDEWLKIANPMAEAAHPLRPGISYEARSAEGLPSSVQGMTEQETISQMAMGEALRRTNMLQQYGYRPGHSAQTETLAKYQPAINAGADAAEKSLREVLKARGFTDGQIAMLIAQYGSLGAAMGALGYGAQQKAPAMADGGF